MNVIPGNAFVQTPSGAAGATAQTREPAPEGNPSETRQARSERVAAPQHDDRTDGHRTDKRRGSVVDIRV